MNRPSPDSGRYVALNRGNTAWVRTTLPPQATAPAPQVVNLVAASTLPSVGLAIPERLTSGFIAIRNMPCGCPPQLSITSAFAADPAPPLADGAGETPAYEKVPGGFLRTLPSPNSCLLPAELQQLRDLLHEFRDRFNDGSEPLPATSLLKARLDTGNAQPISTPPRRLSPAMRQVVRDAVAELDAQEITEPSTGCWSTPIVTVRKASGAWRLCCDYRAINEHVRIPQQPLPRTDDILASFNGKKYFSVIDMCKGFYQIEIAEEDCPKTASSPPTASDMVVYIDDIIVYSDTWDAPRAHLRQLFQALRAANLQLHPGKGFFGAVAVRCLGHIVSRDGIKPCPSKVQAILEMPVPKTAKAVQRFLGKCQYYRTFIPSSSITATPLFQAATRQKNFTWTPAADTAWRTLCKAPNSEPVLAHPDYTRPFYLDCDGSGLGAVLLQPYDEGERVVAYASRSLLDHERK
ncbi:hypothetical protein Emag_007782 [Eimeria magna]